MCDYQGTNRKDMSRRSKVFKYSSGRQRAQRLAMLRKEFESNPVAQEIFEEDIDDSVLLNKYEKMVFLAKIRELRPLSYTTEHSYKSYSLDNKKPHTSSTATKNSDLSGSLSNNKVLVLSNTTDHSNKSESPTTKKVLTLSNIHDHSDKSGSQSNKKALASIDHSDKFTGPSKKMALASSNSIDHSDKFTGPSKKMALASSNSIDHSDKFTGPSKKMARDSSNSIDHSDKFTGPNKKMALASSNSTDHSDKFTGPSKKMALASSNSTDHSDKSTGPRRKTALASSNSTDHSDKSTGPRRKTALASSNSTDHSDESSDKENQTSYNMLQSNERIPHPVAATVSQEKEGHADLVPIGSGRTLVPKDKYRTVKWKSYSSATRTLLRAVFSREVLSTHSLTGKRSPAFPDRPAKMCLDQQKVTDIIIAVRERFVVEGNVIRNLITIKCADEDKMMKKRQRKQEENE